MDRSRCRWLASSCRRLIQSGCCAVRVLEQAVQQVAASSPFSAQLRTRVCCCPVAPSEFAFCLEESVPLRSPQGTGAVRPHSRGSWSPDSHGCVIATKPAFLPGQFFKKSKTKNTCSSWPAALCVFLVFISQTWGWERREQLRAFFCQRGQASNPRFLHHHSSVSSGWWLLCHGLSSEEEHSPSFSVEFGHWQLEIIWNSTSVLTQGDFGRGVWAWAL